MEKERSMKDELRFFKQIQDLGFVLRGDEVRDEDNGLMGWSRSDFETEVSYKHPKKEDRFHPK